MRQVTSLKYTYKLLAAFTWCRNPVRIRRVEADYGSVRNSTTHTLQLLAADYEDQITWRKGHGEWCEWCARKVVGLSGCKKLSRQRTLSGNQPGSQETIACESLIRLTTRHMFMWDLVATVMIDHFSISSETDSSFDNLIPLLSLLRHETS